MATPYLLYAAAFLPFVGLAVAAIYLGYAAYDARVARERSGSGAGYDPRVHAEDLARINSLIAGELREARAHLAHSADTLRRGLKG